MLNDNAHWLTTDEMRARASNHESMDRDWARTQIIQACLFAAILIGIAATLLLLPGCDVPIGTEQVSDVSADG